MLTHRFRATGHLATRPPGHPDMREHGWETDASPDLYPGILASDILVIAGPIWLGDNSGVTKQAIERIYALSGMLNDKGQYLDPGSGGPENDVTNRWNAGTRFDWANPEYRSQDAGPRCPGGAAGCRAWDP